MDQSKFLSRQTLTWSRGRLDARGDRLAVEEPLEIRLGGRRFTITMRTPGHDEELAAGFLFAEGFIASARELGGIRRVRGERGAPDPNALDVVLTVVAGDLRERMRRNFAISSSCGVCGRARIESLRRRIEPPAGDARIAAAALPELVAKMRGAQDVFAATGGLHAAALFGFDGNLRAVREDVGRHNAVDKLVGWALEHSRPPLHDSIMLVSGRASFEIVQKAAAAGVPILAAVSAPSSLAAELADELGTTLVGFLRDGGFNVYAHSERIF
jgi:FdhD protein